MGVLRTCKNFMEFADWKVGFKYLKVFLYLSFTCSNILNGKHKCFVNTFHVSWILFTSKLNNGCYIRVGKMFETVKKWSLVALDRWLFYAVLIVSNITLTDMWVVVMERWSFYKRRSLRQVRLYFKEKVTSAT